MARLPDEFISQLKAANDITDMFRAYADLKKSGRIYLCCCPFHSEKTPSCAVYPENSSFYCFGCGVGGDVIKFVMLTDNVSYMEAVRILAQRCGMSLPLQNPEERRQEHSREKCLEINRETANFYYQNLLKGSDKQGLQYLKQYHIKPETVRKFAVGYAPDEWGELHYHLRQKGFSDEELLSAGVCLKNKNGRLFDKFRHRIIFPVVDFRGNVLGFGGRAVTEGEEFPFLTTEDTPLSSRNNTVFSLRFARDAVNSNSFILAEDYFCTAAVFQAGSENVIAVPENFTAHHAYTVSQYTKELTLLSSSASDFGDIQKIRNFCSDAGISVKIAVIPDMSDSAGFLRQYGKKQFDELLDNAGDAVDNAIDALDKEQDSYLLIQKSAKVLSGIRNPLEREIYLRKTAKDLKISPELLQTELDRITHKKPKTEFASRSLDKTELSALIQPNLKQKKAEEQILVWLLQNPGKIPEIQERLLPEKFVTDSHRNLYQLLCRHGGIPEELPPELSAIRKKYQEITVNEESTEDCIKILLSPRKKAIL